MFEQRLAELRRIKDNGRRTRGDGDAVTISDDTARSFGSPVVACWHFDVEGREIVFEHCYGWRRPQALIEVGRTVDVSGRSGNPRARPGE